MTAIRVIVLDGVDWLYCAEHAGDSAAALWRLAGIDAKFERVDSRAEFRANWSKAIGCAALLRACEAPITPSAVAALLSGRDDGIGWFSEDRFTTSQELIRTRPWFPELARNGMTVGLCNVPLTWPAFPMPKGSWVVSGFPIDPVALNPKASMPWRWPPTLPVTAESYPIHALCKDAGAGGSKDLEMLRQAERRLVDWFLGQAPRADVEVIWLRSTDSAGHHAWGTPAYDETVRHACELAVELAEDAENAIVISDHGFDATDSHRCEAYHRTSHGPAAKAAGLCGSHSEEGILFARGNRIHARGILGEQRLVDVAGGIFDLLQIPPPPGMRVGAPAWSVPYGPDGGARLREALTSAGYDTGAE